MVSQSETVTVTRVLLTSSRNYSMFAAVVVTSFNDTLEIGRACGIFTWVMALLGNLHCEGVWMGGSW